MSVRKTTNKQQEENKRRDRALAELRAFLYSDDERPPLERMRALTERLRGEPEEAKACDG